MENINTIHTDGTHKEKNNFLKIDFHTHILPGIDDGSGSLEESLEMLSSLKKSGVDIVVCSPHFYPDSTMLDTFLKKREASFECLKPHLEKFNIDIRLGAEVYFFSGISKSKSIQALKVEGTDYLLVEMPFCPWREQVVNEIIELNNRYDIKVVIAHIDRYLKFNKLRIFEKLVNHGVHLQMNIDAMNGCIKARKLKKLVSCGMIHFFGSDAHNTTTRKSTWDEFDKYGMKPVISKI